jgi:para-aminobenzoate synthetase component I
MSRSYGLVCEPLELDFPLWRYAADLEGAPYTVLLDSQRAAEAAGKPAGRYSYLAWAPHTVVQAMRDVATAHMYGAPIAKSYAAAGTPARFRVLDRRVWTKPNVSYSHSVEFAGDLLLELQKLIDNFAIHPAQRGACPLPFACGAIGYLGYECAEFFEHLPTTEARSLGLPLATIGVYDAVIGVDHVLNKAYLSLLQHGPDEAAARAQANDRRNEVLAYLQQFRQSPQRMHELPMPRSVCATSLRESLMPQAREARVNAARSELPVHACTSADYMQRVEQVREAIAAGRVFEACLTQQFVSPYVGGAFALYSALRRSNPNPFAAFMTLPNAAIVCASPERFLCVDAHGVAESRPIKGTRARGIGDDDIRLRAELEQSEKDRAENLMIVDLVRSDFARCCAVGSVQATDICVVETHPNVHHMVSTIRGQLAAGQTAWNLLRACFPGGSMTGAPKIEAMQLLRELEPDERGIYSGSMGYVDIGGAMDWNIVIRTVVLTKSHAYYSSGGAIVSDSVATEEYAESLLKVAAIKRALAEAHDLADSDSPT